MKLTFLLFLYFIAAAHAFFGQEPQAGECPKLEVIGPRWIMTPKEPSTFVLQMDQDIPERFVYEWTVENGSVANGQGTRIVEVTTTEYDTNVRVTATVSGLPTGCQNTASEVIGVVRKPEWHVLDEWGEMPSDDQRGRLDLLFFELSNYPAHNGLIVIVAKSNVDEKRGLKLVLDHARFRKFDKRRLFFCFGRSDYIRTRVYRFSPAFMADHPYPGCEPIKGSEIR